MTLIVETSDRVTTVTIDRRECRNAVDGPTAHALADAFLDFEHDENADVAILCGAGDHFCAGADLKAFAAGFDQRANPLNDDMSQPAPMGPSRLQLSKPVIAAVTGYAVAGGMELALWCDLRVVDQSAIFGIFCRRFGVPLIDGGTVRLPRLIGMSHAMDLILTGRAVDAKEAMTMGIANRVVAHGTALVHAQILARSIAAFPQPCLRADRRSLIEQQGLGLESALANEFRHGMSALAQNTPIEHARRFAAGAGRHGRIENG